MGAAASKRNAGFYDVMPVSRRYAKPHTHHPFEVFRKFGQGAGAAYLVMSGSGSMLEPAAGAALDLASLEGFAASLMSGAVAGPLQIVGAVVIFLLAGRCVARFLGLASVAAAFVLAAQGVTISEMADFAGGLGARLSAAAEAFAAAPAR